MNHQRMGKQHRVLIFSYHLPPAAHIAFALPCVRPVYPFTHSPTFMPKEFTCPYSATFVPLQTFPATDLYFFPILFVCPPYSSFPHTLPMAEDVEFSIVPLMPHLIFSEAERS